MSDSRERLVKFLLEKNQSGEIEQLTPDASTREYFRIQWNEKSAIACIYPFDEQGKTQFLSCLDVTQVFLMSELPVAKIFLSDPAKGIIVHEDFGNTILRSVLATSEDRNDLIKQAISLIARIQAATPKAFEMDSISSRLKFDVEKLVWELNFFKTHYFNTLRQTPLSETESELLDLEFYELSSELEKRAIVLCHRDFHAANLMIADGELKIIDHQDARLGSVAYDLVSLLLDRITEIPDKDWLADNLRYFLEERRKIGLERIDFNDFEVEFEMMTVQRCLKAIGTFSFQAANRGKTHFVQYINPMLRVVLGSCEKLNKFPALREIIRLH